MEYDKDARILQLERNVVDLELRIVESAGMLQRLKTFREALHSVNHRPDHHYSWIPTEVYEGLVNNLDAYLDDSIVVDAAREGDGVSKLNEPWDDAMEEIRNLKKAVDIGNEWKDKYKARLAEAEKDTARLDWLADSEAEYMRHGNGRNGIWECHHNGIAFGETLRAAIDEAREGDGVMQKEATRQEIAEQTRAHYEELARHSWHSMSSVYHAIDAWEREPELQARLAEAEKDTEKLNWLVEKMTSRLAATSEPWRFERWTGDGWSWPTVDDCRRYVRETVGIDAAGEGEG